MNTRHDLSQLQWTLTGWMPESWRAMSFDPNAADNAEIHPVPAKAPGSVQQALRDAGLLPDWNVGLKAYECEWVENRHWVYEAHVPGRWLREGPTVRLHCLGLDYGGVVLLNRREVGSFKGSFVPHEFDLTPHLREKHNLLQIVFDCPPRWLGQSGFTPAMRDWKPRFNYGWDWTSRLVQLGIWDSLFIEVSDGNEFGEVRCTTDVDVSTGLGLLHTKGSVSGGEGKAIRVTLQQKGGEVVRCETLTVAQFGGGVAWKELPVKLWWPNLQGGQPLYLARWELLDDKNRVIDSSERTVGFKHVDWQQCQDAPDGADPWICVVNARSVFLQGVNWTPIRPNFADVTEEDYRLRLELYREMGCNILRVWGGAILERECFYNICDELGLMVWQEFPLSSSGWDNWPPEDEAAIGELAEIAQSYIVRRQHHVSLVLWCGGNELQGALDGGKASTGKPIDFTHPLMNRLRRIVARQDPTRRFLPTSASGPRFTARAEDFGKGLHWDVHGEWNPPADLREWKKYWDRDDALFRSEAGCPGASPIDVIRQSKGILAEMPPKPANPLWRRSGTFRYAEGEFYARQVGREPRDLDAYVQWSQERQKQALGIAAKACKDRFPKCGGIIIWMGHDSFPCAANLSVVDFKGRFKPAAEGLRAVFRRDNVQPAQ